MILLLGAATAFVVMILLIKKRVPLGLSLLAGGATVGLFGFRSLQPWLDSAWFALFSRSSLELAAIIVLINLLGCAMGAYGSLDRLNVIMGRLFPDQRYLLAFFPATIGMLNVPGGAILSAPLVDKAGTDIGLSPEQKTAANLLYRHFWFLVYPFYTSMIIINRLSGADILGLIKLGVAPTIVGFLASWKFCFRGWRQDPGRQKSNSRLKDLGGLVYHLSPILAALIAGLVFKINFIPALIIGVIWVEIIHRTPAGPDEPMFSRLIKKSRHFLKDILMPSLKWQLMIIPFGINFFRSTLTATGAAKTLADLLMNLNIPVEALVFIIPLLISITTGLHLASVTISVPLFLPLLGGQALVPAMFLLLTAASVGYWMSPLHLCLILTQEYMKSNYAGTVRIMFWPTLFTALAGVGVYLLAR